MGNVVSRKNATIVTGEYTNAQGEQKKSYLTIGTLFIYDDGGMSLKLDAVPVNGGNINFYDIKPKDDNGQRPQQGYQQPQGQPQQRPQQSQQTENGAPVQYYDVNGKPL